MIKCKKCSSESLVKNGIVRGNQRYKCKECGYNFIDRDARTRKDFEVKRALAILLYSAGRCSFRMIAKFLKCSHGTVYYWLKNLGVSLPEPEIPENTQDVEFDEMWHFLKKSLKNYGLSKEFVVFQVKHLGGLRGVVILKPSKNSTPNSHI